MMILPEILINRKKSPKKSLTLYNKTGFTNWNSDADHLDAYLARQNFNLGGIDCVGRDQIR